MRGAGGAACKSQRSAQGGCNAPALRRRLGPAHPPCPALPAAPCPPRALLSNFTRAPRATLATRHTSQVRRAAADTRAHPARARQCHHGPAARPVALQRPAQPPGGVTPLMTRARRAHWCVHVSALQLRACMNFACLFVCLCVCLLVFSAAPWLDSYYPF